MAHLHFGFETVRNVSLSQVPVQEADHSQEVEKTEEKGGKAACEFGEIGGNCDFTSPRKRLSEFEVVFTNL
jgi:hypothetical protein